MSERRVRLVAVVVPARDEEDELPGCLRALALASARAAASGVHVTTVVTA
ncbi:glycosyl transferase, partial [Streptomyces sp. SID3343]|nr:glycosyl transferase [Streptomyces sp. SID3343]